MLGVLTIAEDFDCRAFSVRAPQPLDGIGRTLRAAFAEVPPLPDDMLAALHRLDSADQAQRR